MPVSERVGEQRIERTFTLKDVQTILNYGRLEGAPTFVSEIAAALEERAWITPAEQSQDLQRERDEALALARELDATLDRLHDQATRWQASARADDREYGARLQAALSGEQHAG